MGRKEFEILQGDCLDVLKTLPDNSVHCVVTSPPYFGLRDYGVDGQIGLEPTPAEFVAAMVQVFDEVRRVLRPDGTCWINLGDSYSREAGNDATKETDGGMRTGRTGKSDQLYKSGNNRPPAGFKPKEVFGIPWRVAFALQDAGWWLRQDIIWAKDNPMPESVRDRCTKAHEYIFLLTKSARYFYDAEAIKEDSVRGYYILPGAAARSDRQSPSTAMWRNVGDAGEAVERGVNYAGGSYDPSHQRNKRSVWRISTKPYSEAHFATFPPDLPETCIRAGTSEKGACAACGSPWTRIVEVERSNVIARPDRRLATGGAISGGTENCFGDRTVKQLGWQRSCTCETDETVPCVVLDPFAGAGTTLLVARRLRRHSIGIELNPKYVELIERRMEHWHKPNPPKMAETDDLGPLFAAAESGQ